MIENERCDPELISNLERIYRRLDNLSLIESDYWIKETKSGLRDIVFTYYNICRSQAIDNDLIKELSVIINTFFNLLNDSFDDIGDTSYLSEKEITNNIDLKSLAIGRKKILDTIQNWILGSRSLFESPNYGIHHRASSLKIGKLYSVILNIFEKSFEESKFNFNKEKICFFCTPVVALETKSNMIFADLPPERGRLISVEISLGSFFDIATGVVLVAHEAGHYLITQDRPERNDLFIRIVMKELAYFISTNLFVNPMDEEFELFKDISLEIRNIIFEWLYKDVNQFLLKQYPGSGKNFIFFDFQLILADYFDSFSLLSGCVKDFVSLAEDLNESIQPKINKFIKEKGCEINRISKNSEKSFNLESITRALFKSGLNISSDSAIDKIVDNLSTLFYKPEVGIRTIVGEPPRQVVESYYFSDIGKRVVQFQYELLSELKADYFVVQVLNLKEEDYYKIMLDQQVYSYSPVDPEWIRRQRGIRLDVLRETNSFYIGEENSGESQTVEDGHGENLLHDYLNNHLSPVINNLLSTSEKLCRLREEYQKLISLKKDQINIQKEIEFIEIILS